MARSYSLEFRQRAVRLLQDRLDQDHDSSESAVLADTALKLGVGTETLRRWLRQVQVDQGKRPGVSSEESAELKRLRKENAELRRANEILKLASVFFAKELDHPGMK